MLLHSIAGRFEHEQLIHMLLTNRSNLSIEYTLQPMKKNRIGYLYHRKQRHNMKHMSNLVFCASNHSRNLMTSHSSHPSLPSNWGSQLFGSPLPSVLSIHHYNPVVGHNNVPYIDHSRYSRSRLSTHRNRKLVEGEVQVHRHHHLLQQVQLQAARYTKEMRMTFSQQTPFS